jgi:hypothetical protein
VQEVDVASMELQKVPRYHILSFACKKLTCSPRKYRRHKISHLSYCGQGDDVASMELQKVPRYHILSIACKMMTCSPRNYRRCIDITSFPLRAR